MGRVGHASRDGVDELRGGVAVVEERSGNAVCAIAPMQRQQGRVGAFQCYIAVLGEAGRSVKSDVGRCGLGGMVELFADRIREQCAKVRAEWEKVTVPREMFTQEDCLPNDYSQGIEGKVVAVKPDVLRPEYRSADHQLVYITGGSGALGSPHGTTCYGKNLYSGDDVTWKRHEILGEVKPEHLPAWAKEKAAELVQNRQERKQPHKKGKEMEL